MQHTREDHSSCDPSSNQPLKKPDSYPSVVPEKKGDLPLNPPYLAWTVQPTPHLLPPNLQGQLPGGHLLDAGVMSCL